MKNLWTLTLEPELEEKLVQLLMKLEEQSERETRGFPKTRNVPSSPSFLGTVHGAFTVNHKAEKSGKFLLLGL